MTKRSWLPATLSVLLLIVAVVAPLALLTWFVFFTPTFSVQKINVTGARPDTTAAIEQLLQGQLGHAILLTPGRILEYRITNELPSVAGVHLTRQLPGTIKVAVQEKTPALLLLASGTYYFVDSDGAAYEQAKLENLPGIVIPTVKTKDAQAKVTIGAPVVSATFVQFVEYVQKELPNQLPAHVVDITIPSLAAREVSVSLDNNWQVRFDTTRTAAGQLQLLKQVLDTTIPETDKAALDYIDLRISDRIYYKLKGAVF